MTEKKKVAKIVIERPPLSQGRLWLFTAIGLVGGLLIGALLWLLDNYENADFPAVYEAPERYAFMWALSFIGMVLGFVFGWSWHREVKASIQQVDAVPMGGRRGFNTSTALVRTEYRSRY